MANVFVSLVSGSNYVTTNFTDALSSGDPLGGTVTVQSDGYLIAGPGTMQSNGMALGGGPWTVTIKGAVGTYATGSSALYLPGAPADTAKVTLDVDGLMFGYGTGDYGIYSERKLTFTNKGYVDVIDVGVGAFGGSANISNYGTIEAGNIGIRFAVNAAPRPLPNIVLNSGRLFGHTSAIVDEVGGSDKVTNTKTGSIIGDIDLGGGDDILNNAGWIRDNVSLGAGVDTVTNSGGISGSLSTGDNDDIIQNTGLVQFGISAGAGKDRVTSDYLNFSFWTNIDLGAGDDSLYGGVGQEIASDLGGGTDTYKLGGGNDVYDALTSGTDGNDIVDGGTGIDRYQALGSNRVVICLDTTNRETIAGFGNSSVNVAANVGSSAWGLDVSGAEAPSPLATAPTTKDTVLNIENVELGAGNDVVWGSAAANYLRLGLGNNIATGLGGNDTLAANGGNNTLEGGAGNDMIEVGGSGANLLYGDSRVAFGASSGIGNDRIYGADGNDTIVGGGGADVLWGGDGDDIFVYLATNESGVAKTARDTIGDFQGSGVAGGDLIDLANIAASTLPPTAPDFVFTAGNGLGAFTAAGQIRFQYVSDYVTLESTPTLTSCTLILGETTGDGRADFAILVNGNHRFSTDDFVLSGTVVAPP